MDKELIKEMRKVVKNGELDKIIRLLKDNESLLYVQTPFGTWLNDAVKSGKIEVVNYFLERDLDVNHADAILGITPIVEAASDGYVDIVNVLYNNGATFEVGDFKNNPLFAAIYGGHFEVVKYLVENGIDITANYPIGTLDNVDAYEYARQYGQVEIAEYLKEKLDALQE